MNLLFYAGYVLVIALLRWKWDMALWLFALGVLLGGGMVYVDRLLQVLLVRPHEHLSEHVKHLLRERRYLEGLRLLKERGDEQQRLTIRSVFFMGVWVPVAIYVLSSTGSSLATGLVMGMGLYLLIAVWRDWSNWERLREWLFWPIRRQVSDTEIRVVVVVYTVVFVGMSLGLV